MPDATTGKTIAANTGWRMGGSVIRLAMQAIWTICLSRWLTPGDFGILAYAMVIVGFAEMASRMGVGPALIQIETLNDRSIRSGFTLSIIMGATACIGLLITAPVLASGDETTTNVMRVLSSVFLVMGVNVVASALLQRQHRFKELVFAECVAYFLGYLVISLSLSLVFRNVWCLVAGMLANITLRSFLNWYHVRHPLRPLFSWQEMKPLLKFGLVFTVTRSLNYSANNSDAFLTRNLFGKDALGLYARAMLLIRMPAALTTRSMHVVLFPVFSRLSDRERIRAAYYKATMFGLCLLVPLCCTVLVTAPEMVVVPFGEQWTGVVLPLQILSPVAFLGICTLGDAVLKSINRLRTQLLVHATYFTAIVSLVIVCSIWMGGPKGDASKGIQGVAIGVLLANVVMYVHMAVVCARVLEADWNGVLRAHFPALIIGCFVLGIGLTSRFLMMSIDCPAWATWGGVSLCCGLSFLGISIIPSHSALREYRRLFGQFALAACAKNRHTNRWATRLFRFAA